jgi:hypothetical protein
MKEYNLFNKYKKILDEKIVADYSDFIHDNYRTDKIWDIKILPHPKEKIMEALIRLHTLETISDEKRIATAVVFIYLSQFQKGVGDKELSHNLEGLKEISESHISGNITDDQLRKLTKAEMKKVEENRVVYESFNELVLKEMNEILPKRFKQETGKIFFNRGFKCQKGKGIEINYSHAVKWYALAAEVGHDKAQFFLGTMLMDEKYGHANINDGIKWLSLSAKQGYDMAQYCIGMTHIKWNDNYESGVGWLKMAAEQSNSIAQYELGKIYLNGVGVIKDIIKAYKWLDIAGNNGQQDAKKLRDCIEKEMTSAQITDAQKLKKEWVKKYIS